MVNPLTDISCRVMGFFCSGAGRKDNCMTTQIELARDGIISGPMEMVARKENLPPETIRDGVAAGEIVIPCNPARKEPR